MKVLGITPARAGSKQVHPLERPAALAADEALAIDNHALRRAGDTPALDASAIVQCTPPLAVAGEVYALLGRHHAGRRPVGIAKLLLGTSRGP